jgi:hypothetical protein
VADDPRKPDGDKPPKRRPIQYSAPPSRSVPGVPHPEPRVPPIPTPLDVADPAKPLDAETTPNMASPNTGWARALGVDPEFIERVADVQKSLREWWAFRRATEATSDASPALDNMRKAFSSASTPAETKASMGHGSGKGFSLSRDDAIFWVGVAIFSDGLYIVADHPTYGIPLIILGVALLAWSNRGHMPRPQLRLAVLVLAMIVTGLVAGYDLYERHFGSAAASAQPAPQSNFGFASAPPAKYPSKNYSTDEKKTLLGLVGSISTVLSEQGLPAAQTARMLGGLPWTSEDGLNQTIKKANEVRASLDLIQHKIWDDIIPKNTAIYGVDLNYIVNTKARFDEFSRVTDQFTNQVVNFQRNLPVLNQDQRNWVASLIQSGGGELWWRTGQEFETWIKQCMARMDTEREGLQ